MKMMMMIMKTPMMLLIELVTALILVRIGFGGTEAAAGIWATTPYPNDDEDGANSYSGNRDFPLTTAPVRRRILQNPCLSEPTQSDPTDYHPEPTDYVPDPEDYPSFSVESLTTSLELLRSQFTQFNRGTYRKNNVGCITVKRRRRMKVTPGDAMVKPTAQTLTSTQEHPSNLSLCSPYKNLLHAAILTQRVLINSQREGDSRIYFPPGVANEISNSLNYLIWDNKENNLCRSILELSEPANWGRSESCDVISLETKLANEDAPLPHRIDKLKRDCHRLDDAEHLIRRTIAQLKSGRLP